MLISELREDRERALQEPPPGQRSDAKPGRARHPVVAWAIASLRIMWSAVRHPGQPVRIDYRTGDVWLSRG